MSIPKTRADLAIRVPDDGLMIELGVAAGRFAEQLMLANPRARYLGVDRWSDHHDDAEMFGAQERMAKAGALWGTLRATFEQAAKEIPDGAADLIYIDGYAHTGQEGGKTLDDWWPKLKSGGTFAGHDYCGEYHQTVTAVDAFIAKHGLELNLIHDSKYPSWWTVKP